MHCVRTVTENLYWVGANDHRLALFENIHPIPKGVSYNAYLLLDEKSVLFDTVDWSACRQLLENLEYLLNGTPLDYLVINHMEPDHGASIEEILPLLAAALDSGEKQPAPPMVKMKRPRLPKPEPIGKRYVCGGCGYEYIPELGDPDGDIAPGTLFEKLPEDWVCPECAEPKDQFIEA